MPNFLIIGAAKSGTTSLYHFLEQHPQIYMSPVKEPGFFALEGRKLDFAGPGDELACEEGTVDLASYQKLFAGVQNEQAIGEASTAYISTQGAAQRIDHYLPDVKLIAILRDPVSRAYSNFTHMRRDGREPLDDFEAALNDEARRVEANWEPIWQYRERGFYGAQLQPYFDIFGAERIQIHLTSELQKQPLEVVKKVFGFLGVDEAFVPDVSTSHNESGVPRNRALHNALTTQNPLKTIVKPFLPPSMRRKLATKLERSNLEKVPLAPDVRARVREIYRDDIMKLQELIGRDLSSWLK